jgi:hypothetical protein
LSEKQRRAAWNAYAAPLSALSPALQALGHLNLHDARILSVSHHRSDASLVLQLRRGDQRVGYADATLKFSHVTISQKSLQLLQRGERPSNVEILATELEAMKVGFSFRMLLWPKGEAALKFKTMSLMLKAEGNQ